MTNIDFDWFSLNWFYPERLQGFEWKFNPLWVILIGIPILFILRYLFQLKRKQILEVALEKKDIKSSIITYLRFIPDLFLALTFALLIIVLARPQKTEPDVERWTEGIDIVLIVDISTSMEAEDFKPNRLEAAKKTCVNFIKGRESDRIGLVVFSGQAFSLAPLTTDYDLLYEYIEGINFKLIKENGTAIGTAIAAGLNRMEDSDSKTKVMILMSDGNSNAGEIDPISATELAKAYGVKIYTIAIGKDGKIPRGKDFFGNTVFMESNLDETTLRNVAERGGGKFFRVPNNQSLEEVFSIIDKLEKAEIKERKFSITTDFYQHYLMWAFLFFLFWLLTKTTFITNLLLD